MKSLILKDLYNIGHNAKSMLLILLVFAIGLIRASGGGKLYYFIGSVMQHDDCNNVYV